MLIHACCEPQHVPTCPQTLGWLVRHLNAVLQHADGEVRTWVAGEPQPEAAVAAPLSQQRLTQQLKGGHEALCQVAVLHQQAWQRSLRGSSNFSRQQAWRRMLRTHCISLLHKYPVVLSIHAGEALHTCANASHSVISHSGLDHHLVFKHAPAVPPRSQQSFPLRSAL